MKSHYYIKEDSWLARIAAWKLHSGQVAMVIGRTIHLHHSSRKDFLQNKAWLCHELKHVEQYERLGLTGFLIRYLWASMKFGYHENPFEIEARAAEQDESLLQRFECRS